MRGGYYRYSSGNLDAQSINSYYWSRRLDNAINGVYLRFLSTSVNPQSFSTRGLGFSLRCLGC